VVVPSAPVARGAPDGDGAYAVSMAGVEAVARGFAVDCEQAVGVLDTGGRTAARGDDAPDEETVAAAVRWAATDADPGTLDGSIIDVADGQAATQ
jgi:hypothetical protein